MEHGPPRRRRARPVADAPIDALLVRVEDLTKGWLLALLEQAPLEQAPGILAVDLTRDGPRICDAVVRALADDTDLRRLELGGALEPLLSRTAAIAGAESPVAAMQAVDALHGVIWAALRAELPWPDPEQVSDLAERLTLVCEHVRGAALRNASAAPAPLRVTRLADPEPAAVAEPPGPLQEVAEPPETVAEPRERRDERNGGSATPSSPRVDPLWVGAIEDEIRQAQQAGASLSLLLVELDDGERVRVVEPERESAATFGHFAQAVRTAVRREDLLACETETRAWIIARETARWGAKALAERISAAVEQAPAWRGVPLSVSVGFGVLGEDGADAATLIEASEQAMFTASASGLRVMPQAGDEPPPAAS